MFLHSNLSLASFSTKQVNSIPTVHAFTNLPLLAAIIAVNIWTAITICHKEETRINRLIICDCAANVLSMGLGTFAQSKWFVLDSAALCSVAVFLLNVLFTWNRMVTLVIAIFRYVMVCHAVMCQNLGERLVWLVLVSGLVLLSLGEGLVTVVTSLLPHSNSHAFLRCIGRQELFSNNLANFLADPGPRGVEFSGPFWSPARLFINITNFAFVFLTPILYGFIFYFRKAHSVTILGINESERQRRKESNKLSTKINFIAWSVEFLGFLVLIVLSYPLNIQGSWIFSLLLAPLFYVVAANKENLKGLKLCRPRQNSVAPA